MTQDDRRIALFAAAFFAVTAVTIAWTRIGGGLALVWPGTAIAAALLIELPRARWPLAIAVIGASSVIATTLFGLGRAVALPLAIVNSFEVWMIAHLLLLLRPRRDWFDSVRGLAAFVAIVGVVVPMTAALPAGLVVSQIAPGTVLDHAASWWMGHGLGTLIGLPVVLIMISSRFQTWQLWSHRRTFELVGHIALVGLVSLYAIGFSKLPVLFLPIVPLLLATFRCGREGAVMGLLTIAGVATATMLSPASPLQRFPLDMQGKLMFVQFYLATLSLLAIPVSVALRQYQMVVAERDERKALARLVADHADVALLNLGPHGDIRYASPAALRLAGIEAGAVIGAQLTRFFDPIDEDLVRAALLEAAAIPGDTASLERAVVRGEDQIWLETRIRAVATEGQNALAPAPSFAVTIRDITARKQTELAAIAAADTDALTGLPNRRALLRNLEHALDHAHQRPFALAILDLDHFKAINDTHGHPVGDMVLREVAGAMRRLAGPGRLFARLGGEEFALLAADGPSAVMLCEQLRRAVAELTPRGVAGKRLAITASVGLIHIDQPVTTAQALESADRALYRAKHEGRNRVVTAPRRYRDPSQHLAA